MYFVHYVRSVKIFGLNSLMHSTLFHDLDSHQERRENERERFSASVPIPKQYDWLLLSPLLLLLRLHPLMAMSRVRDAVDDDEHDGMSGVG